MIPLSPAVLRLVGVGLAAALLFSSGWAVRGWRADTEMAGVKREWAEQREKAVRTARAEEQKQQEAVNEALRKQNLSLADVNADLVRDINGLRLRPPRTPSAGVPQAPRADCQGGTGAELSREDAEFLVGEAARADTLRVGLVTCYEVIDASR